MFQRWFTGIFFPIAGDVVVTTFFVISGFLTSLSGRPEPASFTEGVKFVFMRWLRLAPIYYIAWVLRFGSRVMSAYLHQRCTSAVALYPALIELTMLQSWLTIENGIKTTLIFAPSPLCDGRVLTINAAEGSFNGPAWFVSSLMGCTMIFAIFGRWLMAPLTTPCRALLATLLACGLRTLCFLAHQNLLRPFTRPEHFDFFHHWPPAVFFAFFAGCATAKLVNLLQPGGSVRGWWGWVVVDPIIMVVSLVLMGCTLRVWPYMQLKHWSPIFCLFCFMNCCTHHGPTFRFLSHPALTSLGPPAYAAYLVQNMMFDVVNAFNWVWEPTGVVAAYIFFIGGTWTFGCILHYNVEIPIANRLQPCIKALR